MVHSKGQEACPEFLCYPSFTSTDDACDLMSTSWLSLWDVCMPKKTDKFQSKKLVENSKQLLYMNVNRVTQTIEIREQMFLRGQT